MNKFYIILVSTRDFVDTADYLGYSHTRTTSVFRDELLSSKEYAEKRVKELTLQANDSYDESDPKYTIKEMELMI